MIDGYYMIPRILYDLYDQLYHFRYVFLGYYMIYISIIHFRYDS